MLHMEDWDNNKLVFEISSNLEMLERSLQVKDASLLRSSGFLTVRQIHELILRISKDGSNEEKAIVSAHEFYELSSILEREILVISVKDLENDPMYFEVFKEEVLPLIDPVRVKLNKFLDLKTPTSVFLKVYTKKYSGKKEKKKVYKHNLDLIEKVEDNILEYFENGGSPGGSTLARRSSYVHGTSLHAWIPAPIDNHRILYEFVPEEHKIIFLDIGTHKELGISSSES